MTTTHRSRYLCASIFLLVSLFFFPQISVAKIEATDSAGNKYLLKEDGTYKKLEKKGLANTEVASRIVSAIKTYKKIYKKDVSEEHAKCINKMILDNAGASKWQNLHFLNQPWSNIAKWVETLPIKDGFVTNDMLIAQGQMNILGTMLAAKKYCGLQ